VMRNPIRRGINLVKRIRRGLRARMSAAIPSEQGPAPSPQFSNDPDYDAWLQQHRLTAEELRAAETRAQALQSRPLISVVMPVYNSDPRYLAMALQSVENQIYDNWEICIADDASSDQRVISFLEAYQSKNSRVKVVRLAEHGHIAGATNAAIGLAEGDFLAFLDHDDELEPHALLEVAEILQADPDTDLIYSDHDILSENGLFHGPNFKPAWSPELLLSYMYFGHLKIYRTALVRQVGGLRAGFEGSADYDLALRLVELTDRVRHIPRILYHWRAVASSMARSSETKSYSFDAGRRAVQEALERRGISATALQPEWAQKSKLGIYKLSFADTANEPVTIIIPTRDKHELLQRCIKSIEKRTRHQAYQILIVDNESRDAETLRYLAGNSHRVVRFATPAGFNFAEIVNFAVSQVETDFFVLLNNDTEVIAPEWLDEMLGYGRLPNVGAVGAKLLYPDQRIQHAGVIMGVHGLTGHACQPIRNDQAPLEYARAARNYLAVTAACMLSRKSVFEEVGGFNARDLKVAWNDVDYCLRLRDRGYRVVMNPYAELYHLESQSRGDDKNENEIAFMKTHWGAYIAHDPFFNLNFSRANSEFRLKTDANEARNFYYG
jgi:glycosyltransferase involved in cell wall biosynthesis